jgi:hypothetical protein
MKMFPLTDALSLASFLSFFAGVVIIEIDRLRYRRRIARRLAAIRANQI